MDAAIAKLRAERPNARIEGAAGDLGTAEGAKAVIAAIPEVDILVNNTGIYDVREFAKISDAEWQKIFDVNVMSGVRMTRHYLTGMLKRNWGRVIFVASESAVFIPEEMIHYGFSKAAQLAVARGCAELTKGTMSP